MLFTNHLLEQIIYLIFYINIKIYSNRIVTLFSKYIPCVCRFYNYMLIMLLIGSEIKETLYECWFYNYIKFMRSTTFKPCQSLYFY